MEIKPEDVGSFLENLPISKLWGVGKATEEVLKGIGIFRVGQLARYPPEAIEKKLGKFGLELLALARGEDDRPVVSNEEAKSVSQEQTFTPDLRDRQVIEQMLLDQAEQVGRELRKQKLKGFTVHLKVRYPDFTLTTRSQTLPFPTDAGTEIYRTAVKLLDKTEALSRKARLLGVGVSNLHTTWPSGTCDRDGDVDIAVCDKQACGAVTILTNDGGGVFSIGPSVTGVGDRPTSIVAADFDRDGDLDLAVGNVNGPNRVYDNVGGTLSLAWSSTETDATQSVAWGDWDCDGDFTTGDLVLAFQDGGCEPAQDPGAAAVPEPCSIVLWAIAMIGVWSLVRRPNS